MKTQSIYTADDGTRFDTEAECVKYEKLCARVKAALAPLGAERDIESMSYWQHDRLAVAAAWLSFIEICREEFSKHVPWLKTTPADKIHPASFLGRVLSDDGRKCLSDAGYRFHTIDEEGREFDQPFWAYHRRNGETLDKHMRLNPIGYGHL